MKTIIVKTQAELDALPKSFEEMEILFRIFSKCKQNRETKCWEFFGSKWKGYGTIRGGNKQYLAHRVVARIVFGNKKLDVMHDCDNRCCVNPRHLRYGTRSENIRDAVVKGKIKRGIDHKQSVLDKRKVNIIVRSRDRGMSFAEISKIIGCSKETTRRNYYLYSSSDTKNSNRS